MKITKEEVEKIVEKEVEKVAKDNKGGGYEPHIWPDELDWPGGSENVRKEKDRKSANRKKTMKFTKEQISKIVTEEL